MSGFLGAAAQAVGMVTDINTLIGDAGALLAGNGAAGSLTLGGVAFADEALPAQMRPVAKQRIIRQIAPGGAVNTVILGTDYEPLAWDGILYGADALARAHVLEAMRDAGQIVPLRWMDRCFMVQIERFATDDIGANHIKYHLACIVIGNGGGAAAAGGGLSAQDGLLGSLGSAAGSVQASIAQVTAVLGAAGISLPVLGQVQAALGAASGAVGAVNALATGTAAFTSAASALGSVGAAIGQGITASASALRIATGAVTTTANAALATVNSAADAVAAQAGLAQAGAYTGAATANFAQASGNAFNPIGH